MWGKYYLLHLVSLLFAASLSIHLATFLVFYYIIKSDIEPGQSLSRYRTRAMLSLSSCAPNLLSTSISSTPLAPSLVPPPPPFDVLSFLQGILYIVRFVVEIFMKNRLVKWFTQAHPDYLQSCMSCLSACRQVMKLFCCILHNTQQECGYNIKRVMLKV